MGSFSNYAEDACLNHLLTTPYTSVATVYLALATADPTDAGTGASMSEVANSGAYARTAITFGAAASRRVTQSGAVVFPEATGNWSGPITHWAVLDSGTHGAGNMLAHGAFATPFSVVTGNIRTVPTTEVYVEFSANIISNYAANGFLDRMFRNQAFTVSNTWLAVCTVAVADTMTGTTITEPGGGVNYSRTEVNEAGGASPAWTAASGGAASNANDIVLPDPSGSWGNIKAYAVCDAATVGNLLFYGNDVVDQDVGAETTAILFVTGDLDIAGT